MTKKTKLELTWPGKEVRPRLEPRILIEDPAKSYHAKARREGDIFDNMLIKGDNLLALKALEDRYGQSVQTIYIDPPFNTGEAFEHYPDGLEHSLWLSLMFERLQHLKNLLHPSGSIFIHIDDNELGYLIPIADEVFGRTNRISVISFKQSSVSGPKSRNPGVVSTGNFILLYAADKSIWKNKNTYRAIQRDPRYNQFIENFKDPFPSWSFIPLSAGVELMSGVPYKTWERDAGKNIEKHLSDFVIKHRNRVVQMVSVADKDVNEAARLQLDCSRNDIRVFCSPRETADDYYFFNGKQIAFYKSKVREIDGILTTAERVSNIWDDLLSNNVHKEGGVRLPNGKKPEALIKRCLEITTEEGDLVLDSFLGSGTTAAVAHKMGRRWIGIELGDHAETHCLPRLRRVIDGKDPDGVSRAVDWKGGGGFRYFTLGSSLLERDRYGNWIIAGNYNPAMLAEAMCKHMGFTYAPANDPQEYWHHGHSTETDFIYVTTQALTHDACARIAHDVGPDRSLLICCKAFDAEADGFKNLTLVKIPTAILQKCEWGRDDYSLNIQNLPLVDNSKAAGQPPAQDLPLFAEEGAND